MTRKSLLDTGLGLSTVGGAVFAIGASKEPVSRIVVLPDLAFTVLMVVGGVLAVVGAVTFASSFVIERIEEAVTHVAYGDLDSRYVCTQARATDLAGLHALYARYFGDDVPSMDLMRSWISKSSSAFTLVQRVVGQSGLATKQELVGSFKLLPLNAKGVRAIELGQVTGSTFAAKHLCGTRSRPAGYYVGDVVATTRFARGVVMAHLNAALSGKTISIYARPLTRDGLRVMTKHGFVQVLGGRPPEIGRACRLSVADQEARPAGRPKRHRLAAVTTNSDT